MVAGSCSELGSANPVWEFNYMVLKALFSFSVSRIAKVAAAVRPIITTSVIER